MTPSEGVAPVTLNQTGSRSEVEISRLVELSGEADSLA